MSKVKFVTEEELKARRKELVARVTHPTFTLAELEVERRQFQLPVKIMDALTELDEVNYLLQGVIGEGR